MIDKDKDWNDFIKCIEERNLHVDYTDSVVTILTLTESGKWKHGHVNPIYLEVENLSYEFKDMKSITYRKAIEAMIDYYQHDCKPEWCKAVFEFSKKYAQICCKEEWNEKFKNIDTAEIPEDIIF